MGSLCCCSCVDDFDEYAYPSCSIYRNCVCLRFFFNQFLTNGPTFHRLDGRTPQAGTSLVQIGGDAAETTVGDPHSSMNNEQRYTRLQRDGLVSRKMMTHLQEDSHQLTRNASSSGAESLGFSKKRSALESEEGNKLFKSESTRKLTYGSFHVQSSNEDEDICPTCLDEYSTENPKITAKCSHHFHLGCIYEWLERSESCPICGKEMEFSESP